jgi:hypothetical protein
MSKQIVMAAAAGAGSIMALYALWASALRRKAKRGRREPPYSPSTWLENIRVCAMSPYFSLLVQKQQNSTAHFTDAYGKYRSVARTLCKAAIEAT